MLTTTVFPSRYVQGDGALKSLPQEVARFGRRALAVTDKVVLNKVTALAEADPAVFIAMETFGGECCEAEIERLAQSARQNTAAVIVGIGGGKALDTAKAVGAACDLPVIISPTLASTDAPCSALSVIYTSQGAFSRYLMLARNPDVVLVDTAMIAAAPVRFLVSGMGDALSTWFEAEDCRQTGSSSLAGQAVSLAACGLARLCYETLIRDGVAARAACERQIVTAELEHVVEANTLLSGIGFESGGLSGAHAIHNGLSVLPGTRGFTHGEKVAFSTQCLLLLSGRPAAVVQEVYDFCEAVGLPTTLKGIGLADVCTADLLKVAEIACAPGDTMAHVPGGITVDHVAAAIRAADAEGTRRQKS